MTVDAQKVLKFFVLHILHQITFVFQAAKQDRMTPVFMLVSQSCCESTPL